MVINMMDVSYLKPFFYMGFLFAAFTNFNLVGFGGLGLCLALLYVQLKYNVLEKLTPASTAVSVNSASNAAVVDDDLDDDLDA